MTVVPDMSLWTGRIDAAEGQGALRWHQWVKPVADGLPAGAALIGLASDEGVRRNQGRTGARKGPVALRKALANLAWHGHAPLYDAGDVSCAGDDLEGAQQGYGEQVSHLLDQGHLPLGLGGGHEIAFASFSGLLDHLRRKHPQPRIGILNFDAHFDLRHAEQSSSGTPFRQIAEACQRFDMPFTYCCLDVSQLNNTQALFEQAGRLNVRYRLDRQMNSWDIPACEALIDDFLQDVDHLYMTLCLDVLPASQAPGVSAPSAHGVDMQIVEHLVRPRQSQRQIAHGRHRRAQPEPGHRQPNRPHWRASARQPD